MKELTPAIVEMSEVSEIEIAFFRQRLLKVGMVLDNLELVKLYGRSKVLDVAKSEVKSTKSNISPDPVDLTAIDLDNDIRQLMFGLCREYEESVKVNVTDEQGNVVGQAALPPVESSKVGDMVEYLTDKDSLEWMRFQQGFEESACEIVEKIDEAIRYTTEVKVPVPRAVIGLEALADKVRNTPRDATATPAQIVRLLNAAGFPLRPKQVTDWIEQKQFLPTGMVGKRAGYRPSEVMTHYAKVMRKAAKDSFVNRVA